MGRGLTGVNCAMVSRILETQSRRETYAAHFDDGGVEYFMVK